MTRPGEPPIPNLLTVAGSDSGGGAGIQADLKTFAALGTYGLSVVTALTAQNTRGVQAVHPVPAAFVAAQLESVFSDIRVAAVKIGMLPGPDVIAAVAAALGRHSSLPIVLDPVLVATSGDRLAGAEAPAALAQALFPLAAVVTPNLPEAAALLGEPEASSEAEASEQGRRLLALGTPAVLMKGGHADGPESVDLLVTESAVRRYTAPRIPTRNTHGTGCTLSAAIAARLAHGAPLEQAVLEAKRYVTDALLGSGRLAVGGGAGPLHHAHAWW